MMSAGIFSEGGLLANIFGHSTTHEAEEIIEKIGVVTYKYTKFVMGSGLSTFTRKGKVAFEHLEEYLKVHYNIDVEFIGSDKLDVHNGIVADISYTNDYNQLSSFSTTNPPNQRYGLQARYL